MSATTTRSTGTAQRKALTELEARVQMQDVGPLLAQAVWLLDHPHPLPMSDRARTAWNGALSDAPQGGDPRRA